MRGVAARLSARGISRHAVAYVTRSGWWRDQMSGTREMPPAGARAAWTKRRVCGGWRRCGISRTDSLARRQRPAASRHGWQGWSVSLPSRAGVPFGAAELATMLRLGLQEGGHRMPRERGVYGLLPRSSLPHAQPVHCAVHVDHGADARQGGNRAQGHEAVPELSPGGVAVERGRTARPGVDGDEARRGSSTGGAIERDRQTS